MPRIPVPQSDPQLPRPIFSGDQFGAQQGRALQGLGESVQRAGQVVTQRQTQRELSSLNAEIAKAQAELTVEWQETLRTADPNDDQLATNFNAKVKQRLDSIGQKATTREARDYFTRAAAGLSGNFIVTTNAGMANLAEVKAVSDFETTLNSMTDAVSADPLSFDTTLPMLDIMADGFQQAGGLSTETRLKLVNDQKRALARAAARGLIDQNPAVARELIGAGSYSEYLTGDDKASLINYADGAIAAQEAARRKALEDAASQATTEYLRGAVNPDGSIATQNLPALLSGIARDPRLATGPGSDQQRAIFNMIRGLAETEGSGASVRTDPAVFRSLWDGAALPPGSPGRPTRAQVLNRVGSGLKITDAENILKRLDNGFTPEGEMQNTFSKQLEKAARATLATQRDVSIPDPEGERSFAEFQSWALAEERRLLDSGVPTAEIYAPDGPLYANINRFQRDPRTDEARARRRAYSRGQAATIPPRAPVAPPEAALPPEGRRTAADAEKFLRGEQ